MAISNSHLSYSDCYEVMEKAIADRTGIRIHLDSEASATFFRMRCHQARKIDRERNMRLFAKDHPMHAVSIYDPLVLRIKTINDACYMYLERTDITVSNIESLSEIEPIEHKPTLLIEHKPILDDFEVTNNTNTTLKRRI